MQLIECVANIVLALCMCARKIEFLLCMYLRVFPSPHSKGLAHTGCYCLWVRFVLLEDTFSPFVEASWHNLSQDVVADDPEEEGRKKLAKREVGTKKANSFCRTEKGTEGSD